MIQNVLCVTASYPKYFGDVPNRQLMQLRHLQQKRLTKVAVDRSLLFDANL